MSEPIDIEPIDIEAIRKRWEASTPGPWRTQQWGDFPPAGMEAPEQLARSVSHGDHEHVLVSGANAIYDAAFIAHAHRDIPALLAEVEQLRTTISQIDDLYDCAKAEVERLKAENAVPWSCSDASCERCNPPPGRPYPEDDGDHDCAATEEALGYAVQDAHYLNDKLKAAEAANARLRAEVVESREALRGQVADFRSCNRARQAAEEECARLRARVAELEQAADIATEINNEHVGEADRLRAALLRYGTHDNHGRYLPESPTCPAPRGPCTCGLDAAGGGRG